MAPRTASGALLPALAVGLVLADSSVVTLALPEILRAFDSSVGAVAWVLVSFNLALALAAVPGARIAGRQPRRAFAAALIVFALASAACAAAPSLAVLIVARVGQGLAGAVAVAAALELLVARAGRERAVGRWAAAGVLGAAVGPAAGGLLTEAFSWEAMFALQVPVALLAVAGARGAAPAWRPRSVRVWPPLAPLAALAVVSAALSAALFLLVIMLIEGWRHSPAEAAATVTVMPLAALVAGRVTRGRHAGAVAGAGALLIAGGLGALGLLPGAGPGWTLVPQLAIGAGLGIAVPGLTRGALRAGTGEDAETPLARPAAWTITARHAGIVAGLLLLTPVFTADLDGARAPAERAGLARLLDAPLPLGPKVELARRIADQIDAADGELPDLAPAFAGVDVPARDRPALARLRTDLESELDRAATDAFERSFRAAALLALLALVPLGLAAAARRRRRKVKLAAATAGVGRGAEPNGSRLAPGQPLPMALTGAAALAAALVAAHAVLGGTSYGSSPVSDPCFPRERPAVERLGGTQRAVLAALDGAACELHVGREQMLLALLTGKRPAGATDEELTNALRAGVERAHSEGALGGIEETVLLLALRTGGADAILDLLLGDR